MTRLLAARAAVAALASIGLLACGTLLSVSEGEPPASEAGEAASSADGSAEASGDGGADGSDASTPPSKGCAAIGFGVAPTFCVDFDDEGVDAGWDNGFSPPGLARDTVASWSPPASLLLAVGEAGAPRMGPTFTKTIEAGGDTIRAALWLQRNFTAPNTLVTVMRLRFAAGLTTYWVSLALDDAAGVVHVKESSTVTSDSMVAFEAGLPTAFHPIELTIDLKTGSFMVRYDMAGATLATTPNPQSFQRVYATVGLVDEIEAAPMRVRFDDVAVLVTTK